jgi:NAD-dependent dihydropyrimidine dehydrogenase PreA subunit
VNLNPYLIKFALYIIPNLHFVTFYFSGTGNTWWVAREFTSLAQNVGHTAEFLSIENPSTLDPTFLQTKFALADAIGIAYPIYASTLPKIMWNFLDSLIHISSHDSTHPKIAYTLTTMAFFSGDGALVPCSRMKQAGLILQGAMNFQMSSNLSVPFFRYNPVSQQKLEKRKIRNRKKLRKLIGRLEEGRKCMEGRNPFLIFVGWLQRVFATKELNLISKYWSVDLEKCTKCMLCVQDCPTHSIAYESDEFIFHLTCTACMRCYNRCPAAAIQLFNRSTDPKRYLRLLGPGEGFKIELLK